MTTIEARVQAALGAPMAPAARNEVDDRVTAAIAAAATAPRRRLRFRRGLVLALVILAVPTALAGAAIMTTEDPFGLEEAPGFAAELAAAKAAVPLPEGRSWPAFLTVDPNVSYSRGGGRAWVESVAMCEWFDAWLDARAASDVAREAAAAAVIAGIPEWPSWNSLFWDDSVRDYYRPVIAAVAAGHDAPIKKEMTTNCSWLAGP